MLTDIQTDIISTWIGPFQVVNNMSWGLVDSTVLKVRAGHDDYVVKTAGPDNNHIGREITAYQSVLPELAGHVPDFIGADREHRLLVTRFLPGHLAETTGQDRSPQVMERAGHILSLLHSTDSGVDTTLDRNLTKAALKWLRKDHQIPAHQADKAAEILRAYEPVPVSTVACHGDYSGRNWIVNGTDVSIIDFGRFGHRPAYSDFLRMHYRYWIDEPTLKDAFFAGYGDIYDVLETEQWAISFLREAISTAAWAHQVGDATFEKEGLSLIGPALAECERVGI